jgi:hypothetical protein
VFAEERLPAKALLGPYTGKVLTAGADASALEAAVARGYVLAVKDYFIDGSDAATRNWASYMNSPKGTKARANVQFTRDGNVRVGPSAIAPGKELLIGYGASYWS